MRGFYSPGDNLFLIDVIPLVSIFYLLFCESWANGLVNNDDMYFVHCPVALVTGMRLRVREGLCVLCSASGGFVVLLGLVFDFADAYSD